MNEINAQLQKKYPDVAKEIGGNFFPPVTVLFWTFRIMAGLSMLMILLSALGLFWTRKKNQVYMKISLAYKFIVGCYLHLSLRLPQVG